MSNAWLKKIAPIVLVLSQFSIGRAASFGSDLNEIGDQVEESVKANKTNQLDRAKIILEAQNRLKKFVLDKAADDEALIQFESLKNVLEIIDLGLKSKKNCDGIRAQMVLEYGDRVEDLKDSSKFFLVGLRVLDLLCPKSENKKYSFSSWPLKKTDVSLSMGLDYSNQSNPSQKASLEAPKDAHFAYINNLFLE